MEIEESFAAMQDYASFLFILLHSVPFSSRFDVSNRGERRHMQREKIPLPFISDFH